MDAAKAFEDIGGILGSSHNLCVCYERWNVLVGDCHAMVEVFEAEGVWYDI